MIVRAEWVTSLLIVALVAAVCLSVVLTAGRSVGAQREIVATIDAVGTRSIVVRAEPGAGVDASVIDRLRSVEDIEWAGAFGPATDSRNAGFPGGNPVVTRALYSDDPVALGLPVSIPISEIAAFGTTRALDALGITHRTGALANSGYEDIAIVGVAELPEFLSFMDPIVLVSREISQESPAPVAILVVLARRPEAVAPVSAVVRDLLAASDRQQLTTETSAEYARLRMLIEGQVGGFSRRLVAALCLVLATVLSALMYGLVMLHRKGYGRRRALGATRSLVMSLVLLRTLIPGLVGVLLGMLIGVLTITLTGDPLPNIRFAVALGLLAVGCSFVGAAVPSVVAARRDPLTELRVP